MKEKHVAILLDRGIVSKVITPPLAILPGWKKRAKRVEHLEIILVIDFLEKDDATLAEMFDEDEQTIMNWKAEVWKWLEVDLPKKRC
jgi:hypothetical protein